MNEFDLNQRGDRFAGLEESIRLAGNYIQPTDDLRPKTLEAARSASYQRRTNWRAGAMIAAVLLVAIGQATNQFGWPVRRPIAATAINHEFAQRQQALERGINPGWGLYEAFCELRSKQANLLRDSL
ncbi:hypothetical protein [Bythopirellula polymerisocia]|uniref:Uncharacterized protein n=1 Tax=Bythopirellula polymerisocia TaxID=2528003 RepID=A0A5C6CTW2_9BACT|nr:hypothetical protein [Bythopirellula polymerisocia]TWU28060.1 hypothetical protein Pla144_13470 [Bythopirellula polymerisocia]